MTRSALILFLFAATPLVAQEAEDDTTEANDNDLAPAEAPVPEVRPDPEDRLPAMEAEQAAADEASEVAAEAETTKEPAEDATDQPQEGNITAQPVREVLAESDQDLAACLAALDDLGTIYQRTDPIAEPDEPDCGIVNPLVVSEVVPGVALGTPATLRCEAVLSLARWVNDVVLPASSKLDDREVLATLDVGPGYICRPRADGRLSEHAFGNAIDVMGFRFEVGEPIAVEPREDDGTLAEAFQDATRFGACLDFTTVLGPGVEDHADHIHLDVRDRRGGYRICD